MRISMFVVLAASVAAKAIRRQSTSSLPSCVIPCIASSASGTGCASSDTACLCASTVFISQVASCFASNCASKEEQATGIEFGQSFCSSVGVAISVPSGELTSLRLTTLSNGVITSVGNGVAPPASSPSASSQSTSASSPSSSTKKTSSPSFSSFSVSATAAFTPSTSSLETAPVASSVPAPVVTSGVGKQVPPFSLVVFVFVLISVLV